MSTAIAALPVPARSPGLPTPADDASTSASRSASASDSASIASGDFAALLLGQLPAETALNLLISAGSPDKTPLTDTLAPPQDAALLLASMGISGLSMAPLQSEAAGALTAASGGASSPETELTLTTPADIALTSELAAGARGKADRTAQFGGPISKANESDQIARTALSAADTPAKLAGLGQKLADATSGLGETQTTSLLQATPQQLASAAQLSGMKADSIHVGSESLHVQAPFRDSAWTAEFGQKVVWLVSQDKQGAQITLNPPHMGPIEISLNMKNDQATAAFTSANSEVREAIELAIPRLREMLAGVGVELGQANVSAESFRQQADSNGNNPGSRSHRSTETADTNSVVSGHLRGETMAGRSIKRGNGLVDTFA